MDGKDDLIERLKQLTGQSEIWDGFSLDNVPDEVEEEAEYSYDSDASQDLILSIRHLAPPSSKPAQKRGYKLNKARGFAADAPEIPKTVEKLQKIKWSETGLKQGEVSEHGQAFVPWRLVKEYPNMFIGKRNSERAVPFFTMEALHDKERVWDLFYVHYPPKSDKRPVLFVPTYQFQHLLDVINATLDTQLTIPPGKNELKFNMVLGAGNAPRPRFLGRSTTAEAWKALVAGIPEPDENWDGTTEAGKLEFLELLALAHRGTIKQVSSEKSRLKRQANHQAWGRSTKRAQRYLGLRKKKSGETASELSPASLDISRPLPIKPEGSVLFVSIDIEAYEFNQDIITEVGIAILDAAELAKAAPGAGPPLGSQGWFPLIECRHLRVKENVWAFNQKHVHGCPDKFDFGRSEYIPSAKVVSAVEAIIQQQAISGNKKSSVVLVFHDASADIKFLQQIGYDILGEENVVDVIDTKEMHQVINRSHNPRSLQTVLDSLGISYRYLHNAGNDAMYTMRAMISLAIKQRQVSLANAGKKAKQSGQIPYAEFAKKKEEDEGWSSGGEDSDGGDAPRKGAIYRHAA